MTSAIRGGEFLHTDVYEMAAVLLKNLVRNPPFLQGAKFVGAEAMLTILSLNGSEFESPVTDLQVLYRLLDLTLG